MADFTIDESTIYWLSIAILIVALLIIATSVFFGRILYQEATQKFLDKLDKFTDPAKLLDAFREFLERTNDFWTTYGQIALATFIVAVLAILLLTRTISSEAGLPILSAIASFAIAKGASVSRSPTAPSGSEVPPNSSGGNDESKEVGKNEESSSSIQKSSSINAGKKDEVVNVSSSDDNQAVQGGTQRQEPVNEDQGTTKRSLTIEDQGDKVIIGGTPLTKRFRRILWGNDKSK
jgi:hypothetical protein